MFCHQEVRGGERGGVDADWSWTDCFGPRRTVAVVHQSYRTDDSEATKCLDWICTHLLSAPFDVCD